MTFITRDDLIVYLDMKQVDATTYKVYGESVSVSTIDKHVEFANSYVKLVAGSPTSGDRYEAAKQAALNLAALRVVVVALGGVLVDAFDYAIGEIRVSRDTQYRETIRANIETFRQAFLDALHACVSEPAQIVTVGRDWTSKWKGGTIDEQP